MRSMRFMLLAVLAIMVGTPLMFADEAAESGGSPSGNASEVGDSPEDGDEAEDGAETGAESQSGQTVDVSVDVGDDNSTPPSD